jgi:choline-sulfatase
MTTSNLLVIMSDEHQATAMGCAGHPFVQTPHLDKLANRGVRFTNAYTPSPICVPARASFATGRYAHQNRLWDNAMPYTGNIPGWGHALQAQGTPVESIGKLHYRDEQDPAGFDVEHIPMMVVDGVGMVWASIRKEDERISRPGRMLGKYIGPGTSTYTEYDSAVTEKTIEWLTEREPTLDSPWCLYVGLVAPHFPLVVPEEYFNLYPLDSLPEVKQHPDTGYKQHPWIARQNAFMDSESKFHNSEERLAAIASYYGLCTWMDNNVGKILTALEQAGLSDNTTVVYTSDHGDNVGARGLWGKSNMYEEACAVPLIMAGPDIKPATCNTPVSLLDLSVTITSHFDTAIATDQEHGPIQGEDLKSIAVNTADSSRLVFSEYHAAGAVSGAFMIRKGQWKYIYYAGFEPELFDLEADPEELTNVATDPYHAAILSELHQDLLNICDPLATDQLAHEDQAELIASYGGKDKALALGASAATPPPKT